jgi:hypothetical protein
MSILYARTFTALLEKLVQDKSTSKDSLHIHISTAEALIDRSIIRSRDDLDILTDIGVRYLLSLLLPGQPPDYETAGKWFAIATDFAASVAGIPPIAKFLLLYTDILRGNTAYTSDWMIVDPFLNGEYDDTSHFKKASSTIKNAVVHIGTRLAMHEASCDRMRRVVKYADDHNPSVIDADLFDAGKRMLKQEQVTSAQATCATFCAQKTLQVLSYIAPFNGKDKEQVTARYQSLLKPVPLTPWPDHAAWMDGLERDYPWMGDVTKAMRRAWAIGQVSGQYAINIRPMLLVGSPGLGKSRFLRSLAEALNVGSALVSLSGMNDNMMLKGSSRAWSTGGHGFIIDVMLTHKTANPLICLDEIDKVGTGRHNGRVWETLLAMLEPSTADRITDEYLMAPINYSAINFIATANDVSEIPVPLLSRFSIIHVGKPNSRDFPRIMDNILDDIAKDMGTVRWALPALPSECMCLLKDRFEKHPSSLRQLFFAVRSALEIEAQAQMDENNDVLRCPYH